jgi:diguanylate cyclase (GGDEF)-like protein
MAVNKAGAPKNESPPPLFSLQEAEKIVRRLAPALRAHGLWVHRIHSALICRTLPTRKALAEDEALGSQLGRWLAGEKNELICRHPDHAAALEEHRRLQALARSLCDAVEEGRPIEPAEYQAFADCIGRLERSLEALVKELWDLLRHTDPLTGIATRYAMLPRMREERQRVQRTGVVSSICMVDLDNFKQINDTHGHSAGDAVLEAISKYLVDNLRCYDQVCRYGGEEFVLMLPNTEPKQAVPIVDRLRRGISELRVQLRTGAYISVTASFGIAPLIADQPITASIERADQAMYAAKRAGRNQVRMWEPVEAERAGSR